MHKWILISSLLSGAALGDYRASLYSENSVLTRDESVASQTRLRVGKNLPWNTTPYLQLGQELLGSTSTSIVDKGSSFIYLAPGIEWNFGMVSLFGEARARKFYGDSLQSSSDFRALVVFGDFLQSGIRFLEIYSENLFTSADGNNFISSSFLRPGLRWAIKNAFLADIFLEPFLSVDRLGHYYYNRFDLNPSVRLHYAAGELDIGLITSYVLNYSFRQTSSEAVDHRFTKGARALFFLSKAL